MILTIRDCSLAFKGFYSPARIFERDRIHGFAKSLVDQFSEHSLQPSDVTLDVGDQLFRYLLRATLFNRVISLSISAQTADASFTRLVLQADRALTASCLGTMINVCDDGLAEHCYVEVSAHASFASPSERETFFSQRIIDGIDTAGILGYRKIGEPEQLVRIEVDQSWAYPDAAYIVWKTIGMKLARVSESPEGLWNTLFELVRPLQLELRDE